MNSRILRAWARVAAFAAVAFPAVMIAYRGLPVALPFQPFSQWALGGAVAVLLYGFHRILVRGDGESLKNFGFRGAATSLQHILLGFAAGALLVAVTAAVIGTVLPIGWRINEHVAVSAIVFAFVHHLITNTCEELAWRGYLLFRLRRLAGVVPAIIAVALISALFHVWCGWTWGVALTHTTAGSLLFSLVILRWNSLPAGIGVHAGWNWMRDAVLSFPPVPASIVIAEQPRAWTEAEWSKAGAISLIVTLLACLAVGLRRRQRGNASTSEGSPA